MSCVHDFHFRAVHILCVSNISLDAISRLTLSRLFLETFTKNFCPPGSTLPKGFFHRFTNQETGPSVSEMEAGFARTLNSAHARGPMAPVLKFCNKYALTRLSATLKTV